MDKLLEMSAKELNRVAPLLLATLAPGARAGVT